MRTEPELLVNFLFLFFPVDLRGTGVDCSALDDGGRQAAAAGSGLEVVVVMAAASIPPLHLNNTPPPPRFAILPIMSCPAGGETFTLNSGHLIPAVGLGVYQAAHGEEAYEACLNALRMGYRHIDTAQIYRNEASVGRAIKDSGIPREQIFVTTK